MKGSIEKMEIIRLNPVFKQTIWGGDRIKKDFNYNTTLKNIGESWVISANINGDCSILGGTYDGLKLSELYRRHKELFGNLNYECFPLLTKIIDAREDLSIQVHPDEKYAFENENGASGKTEFWYILDAEMDSKIIIGHNAKNNEEVRKMILAKKWNEFIREVPIKKGDFFMIYPGTIHAIKGGALVLEIQQNCDITYRVYDYDRFQNGKKRQLHLEKSMDVIKAPYVEQTINIDNKITINENMKQYATCDYFTIWKISVNEFLQIEQDQPCMLFSIICGSGRINGEYIRKGDSFIIPNGYGKILMDGTFDAIISSPKNKILK